MTRRLAWLAALVAAAAASARPGAPLAAQSPAAHVVKVVGDRHQLALKSDGTVVGWGAWSKGQLGPVGAIGVTTPWTDRPIALTVAGKVIDVAAGDETSYALLDDGTVWAWGGGREGELGTGPAPSLPLLSNSTRSMEYRGAERPVKVGIDQAAAITAAGHGALAILRDGTVSQWPRRRTANSEPSFRPMAVPTLAGVMQVSMGWSHNLALTTDGRVWAWGSNDNYALGVEPKGGFVNDPVVVPELADVTAVAAAGDVSLVLKKDGSVWAWGSNGQGQFGNGQRTSHPTVGTQPVPQRVPGIANAVAISAGLTGRHVLVVLKDGTLRGWGNTDYGQLGAGLAATFQLAPVTPKIAGVKAVFAVGNGSFAVKTDGSFWGWGNGDKARWPFQAVTKVPTPVALP
jgi:alpha-tubulin suppressor-like RCC1 family protein